MSGPDSILIVYNLPSVPADHPSYASEAGVLESVEAFRRALESNGRRVEVLGLSDSHAPLDRTLAARPTDVVVNFCESFAGRTDLEAHVAAHLELLQQAFTGSPSDCLALVRDKAKTKWLLRGAGLPTAEFLRVEVGSTIDAGAVESMLRSGPVFVKPAAEDASLGVGSASVAETLEAVQRQVDDVHSRFGAALVEQYLPGREFNVGVVALPELKVLPAAEVAFRSDKALKWPILTYDAKWDEGSDADLASPVVCPADVSAELADELKRLAAGAAKLVGFRDYARVDFRLDAAGRPCILEVNGNPDFGPGAGLARALRVSGIDYDEAVNRLVDAAWLRSSKRSVKETPASPASADGFRELTSADVDPILDLLRRTGVFRPDEVEVAKEILEESLTEGTDGHYTNIVFEVEGAAAGWSCHGKVPMTASTFDLYWIAVDPGRQTRGLGRRLLAEVERRIGDAGGTLVVAETSDTAKYAAARSFYERSGYREAGRIDDYYLPGDGRVVYVKRLGS